MDIYPELGASFIEKGAIEYKTRGGELRTDGPGAIAFLLENSRFKVSTQLKNQILLHSIRLANSIGNEIFISQLKNFDNDSVKTLDYLSSSPTITLEGTIENKVFLKNLLIKDRDKKTPLEKNVLSAIIAYAKIRYRDQPDMLLKFEQFADTTINNPLNLSIQVRVQNNIPSIGSIFLLPKTNSQNDDLNSNNGKYG